MSDEKLQKVLARSGFGSRREMERWIEAGRIRVNEQVATLGIVFHRKIRWKLMVTRKIWCLTVRVNAGY